MRTHIYGIFALVLASQCDYGSSGNNFRNGYQLDYREIARQNKITEQILQNYLEKRLFPHNQRPSNAPTVWDILPRARRKPSTNNNSIQDVLNTTQETLESGESERISFFNDEEDEKTKEDEELEARFEGRSSSGPSRRAFSSRSPFGTMYRCLLLSASILGTLSAAGPSVRSGAQSTDCPNCIDDSLPAANRWTMPLLKLGEKRYYLGIFFKANYFRATQYCRFHGMHLASITSQEENDKLEKYIKDFGLGHEHFWTSGTDLAEEGHFFWMSTGRPITFTNWNAGEPNNFQYENGEEENCLELWNRDGKGLKWNDSPCSFETYFVCEVQQ